MTAYYNEHDPFAAEWLRSLIKEGLIADGEVDSRSIVDVRPTDLAGYEQCHFFAGIGGWSYALRLAGWSDDRPVWTGSCPCQPFSVAGKKKGFADDRHLWSVWRDLISEREPPVVFGEQVASATDWLGLVRGDLEAMGYAVGAFPIQAASAGADHLRDRFWFVANSQAILAERESDHEGNALANAGQTRSISGGSSDTVDVAYATDAGRQTRAGDGIRIEPRPREGLASRQGDTLDWVIGADGKARRVKSGVRLLAHGVPNRVGLLRGFGNAIDPRPAAAFIKAAMTCQDPDDT